MTATVSAWVPRFACPKCRGPVREEGDGLPCRGCGAQFASGGGLFRFLDNPHADGGDAFAAQYRLVRARDHHRSASADYYRMLPSVPRDHPLAGEWRLRRESYARLQEHAIPPSWVGPVRILELGAGCAWLSYRLATLGYSVVAVDRLDDEADGLGACRHYPIAFPAVQADFGSLPFEPEQFEVAVFAGSLHYSPDPCATLREAARAVVSGGTLAVMDSPMFTSDADGEAMVADAHRRMAADHGLAEIVRPGIGYLTFAGMREALAALGLRARFFPSRGPITWRMRRQLARLRLRRAPAAFGVWVAR